MELGLKGEKALLMASTQGLGFGCAEVLLAEGVEVVVSGRDAGTGAEAVAALGAGAHFVQADVAKPEDRERLFTESVAHLGHVSILLTNAGGPPTGPFLERTLDDWRTYYELTMLSAIHMATLAVPDMIERGWGRIVNVSTLSVKESTPNTPLANALKTGVVGALGTLAREIADKGVTVNNIAPGPFDTALLRRVSRHITQRLDLSEEEAVELYAQQGPMKRMGTIQEFGACCAFLCSRHAGYITAQSIVMDGGHVRALF